MKVEVAYQCQHITCRIPLCHDGKIVLEKEKFDMYCQSCTEPGCFISPSNTCKIGHNQVFKILEKKTIDENVVQMAKQHEMTLEEKKELHNLTLNNGEPVQVAQIVPVSVSNLATVDQITVLEKKIKDLEVRVEKMEGWKKGSKVSRKEE